MTEQPVTAILTAVNAADVVAMINYLFGSAELGSASNADMNSDGKVNIADLCLLKNVILFNAEV